MKKLRSHDYRSDYHTLSFSADQLQQIEDDLYLALSGTKMLRRKIEEIETSCKLALERVEATLERVRK